MRTISTTRQSFRSFLMVSGICWLLHNAIVIAADRSGGSLALSLVLSFAVTIPFGYFMHSLITFRNTFALAAFLRYVLAMSTNIPLALVALWLWRDVEGLRIEIAAPAAAVSTTLANFMLCRFAVFDRRETSASWVRP